MEPVSRVEGTAVPLDRSDVDTDQIVPAQFLKRIERTGFGPFLFHEWRKDPSFVLNDERYAGAIDPARGRQLRRRVQSRARALGTGGPRIPRGDRPELRRHLPQQLLQDRAASRRATPGVGPSVDGRRARRSHDADRRRPGCLVGDGPLGAGALRIRRLPPLVSARGLRRHRPDASAHRRRSPPTRPAGRPGCRRPSGRRWHGPGAAPPRSSPW